MAAIIINVPSYTPVVKEPDGSFSVGNEGHKIAIDKECQESRNRSFTECPHQTF